LAQAFALNDLAMPPPGVPVLQRFHFYIWNLPSPIQICRMIIWKVEKMVFILYNWQGMSLNGKEVEIWWTKGKLINNKSNYKKTLHCHNGIRAFGQLLNLTWKMHEVLSMYKYEYGTLKSVQVTLKKEGREEGE
jgi:hypothetical protein